MTDNPTLSFYNQHADAYIKQTRQIDLHALYDAFVSQLPTDIKIPQHILDVGCGSGRDSFWFSNSLGANVTAIDGSSELIKRNQAYYAASNINWRHLKFKDIKHQGWQNQFIGIWACASLLHLPFNELPNTLEDLMDTLVSGGTMYASFKHGDSGRWEGDRFFCDMNKERFVEALQLINFNSYLDYKTWISADQQGGREVEWFNVLLIKRGK
ncbi:class I SAM-dependent methyltransferase [Psychrobacter sp. UBA3962]|uniref:class I SAM-dependent methyltransferase n=1 Tax=Psychrobacter sp. UBA3962 TaxID=1947352 RepID=UPI0025E4A845|nr:class I SAM-dependent methyltransferase [Psychrobacter sp. UBA3962]